MLSRELGAREGEHVPCAGELDELAVGEDAEQALHVLLGNLRVVLAVQHEDGDVERGVRA